MRHPDGRQIQHGAEMNSQTSLAGMILARGVDQQDFGQAGQRANGLGQQWPFA
jgi:hypothetical protein